MPPFLQQGEQQHGLGPLTRAKLFLRKNWNWKAAPKAMSSRVKSTAAITSTASHDSQKAAAGQQRPARMHPHHTFAGGKGWVRAPVLQCYSAGNKKTRSKTRRCWQ